MSSINLLPELSKEELEAVMSLASETKSKTRQMGRLIVDEVITVRIEEKSNTRTSVDNALLDECQAKLSQFNSEMMVRAKPKSIVEDSGLNASMKNIDLFLEVVMVDESGIYVSDHESDYWRIDPKGIEADPEWENAFRLPYKSEPYVFADGKVSREFNTCASLRLCDGKLYVREPHGNAMMYYPLNGGSVFCRGGR